ncbi:MAG: ABC transporter permease [Elusimicrobia bacterium]|nr:ABC transporter permease [Elusimicrobiota bacterium]
MNLAEGIVMGWGEIKAHKMRSFLSFFGITIGIASVLMTIAILQGFSKNMKEGMALSGPGRLEVTKKWTETKSRKGVSQGLTSQDALSLEKVMPELQVVIPKARSFRKNIIFKDIRAESNIVGVVPEAQTRDWVYDLRGRFFTAGDMQFFKRVCVLIKKGEPGQKNIWRKFWKRKDPFEQLYAKYDPLGQSIRIQDNLFTIIGIAQEPPEDEDPRFFHRSYGNEMVWVPLTTFQKYIQNSNKIDEIIVDTGDPETTAYYEDRLKRFFLLRHRGEEDFDIQNYSQLMSGWMKQVRNFRMVFLLIAIISLIAGGIGIMNVSLATVYSRIKEIGIRKAVGATRLDILVQFVLESTVLSVAGGLVGVALGIGGAFLLPSFSDRFEIVISPLSVLLCISISIGVGMIFSIYPAYQAAKLDPVEALRYE